MKYPEISRFAVGKVCVALAVVATKWVYSVDLISIGDIEELVVSTFWRVFGLYLNIIVLSSFPAC